MRPRHALQPWAIWAFCQFERSNSVIVCHIHKLTELFVPPLCPEEWHSVVLIEIGCQIDFRSAALHGEIVFTLPPQVLHSWLDWKHYAVVRAFTQHNVREILLARKAGSIF